MRHHLIKKNKKHNKGQSIANSPNQVNSY